MLRLSHRCAASASPHHHFERGPGRISRLLFGTGLDPGVRVSTIAFYSGELMSPEAIRAAHPEAQFIARAAIPAGNAEIAKPFNAVIGDTIWGIAVELGTELGSDEVLATADDGRSLRVVVIEPLLGGDPATVLANARYWELPPAFVSALQSVVQPGHAEE